MSERMLPAGSPVATALLRALIRAVSSRSSIITVAMCAPASAIGGVGELGRREQKAECRVVYGVVAAGKGCQESGLVGQINGTRQEAKSQARASQ